jgi:m7GpppX diphosphatase
MENLNELIYVKSNGSKSVFCNERSNTIMISDSKSIMSPNDIIKYSHIETNDKYSKYSTMSMVVTDVTTICPYDNNDYEKYIKNKTNKLQEETPEIYQQLYPEIIKKDKLWIYNIIEGISEQEKIIYQDDNFVLLPDYNWPQNSTNLLDMHYLVIVKRKDLLSIRDLTNDHIKLLQDIDNISKFTISNKHNIDPLTIRSFVHYYPTFWHFHIHFDLINSYHIVPLHRCHLLHNIIINLKIKSDYYKEVILLTVV